MPLTKATSNKLKASKKPSATKASKPVSKGDKVPVIWSLPRYVNSRGYASALLVKLF